jgi:class 3 adenylate cyclase
MVRARLAVGRSAGSLLSVLIIVYPRQDCNMDYEWHSIGRVAAAHEVVINSGEAPRPFALAGMRRVQGHGVLAYFGWPQAHEDEAERAVRAGLDLVAPWRDWQRRMMQASPHGSASPPAAWWWAS